MRDLKSQKPVKVKGNRRKQKKQKRDWKKFFHRTLRVTLCVGTVALVVSGGTLVAQMLLSSGYFDIENIRVENQNRVSREDILDLSNIHMGSNVFDLDLELIGRKIEENPWIATARVERVFPREVVITVKEREPMAVASLGYLYYVDVSGGIFKLLGAEDNLDYPVVSGIDRNFMLENPQKARQLLADAMGLLEQIAKRGEFNLTQISELHIDPQEGFDLYTYVGGVPIHMGTGNFTDKLDRLERIYSELEPRLMALQYIDLNVADRVIVKIDRNRTYGNG